MGCKVNQYESAQLSQKLVSLGYELVEEGDSQVSVLNACVVTARAEKEALQILRRLRRESPEAKIIVMGCLYKLRGKELLEEKLIDAALATSEDLCKFLGDKVPEKDPLEGALPHKGVLTKEDNKGQLFPPQRQSRAFFKIQDGCDQGCHFCIIPSLRGRSRSLPLPDVIRGIVYYFQEGFSEIVLTGIHLGAWGREEGENINSLLEHISQRLKPDPKQFRLRLSSIEPTEAAQLIDAFASYPWLAKHLHIPLQSGSDYVLSTMNRPYLSLFYRDLVEKFKNLHPQMCLGTDIIVGYPTEDDSRFQETLNFLEGLPLSYHHIFPYSERSGTIAATLEPKLSSKVIKMRAKELKALNIRKRMEYRDTLVGRRELVLVENSLHAKSARQKGLSGGYQTILLPDNQIYNPRKLYDLELIDTNNPYGLLEGRDGG
ncbi:MAG: MiaB/RimO family radical SAM methylthiotransferase [Deltaproteobacteria bacterium]|jgi:threonylcarbamoyladenosine tRNA methylthiotransferase MtaB|nr:MiaB/RimO family radical SAM methylthiotransferase [Deltaproteobacteria bacterium]